MLNFFNYNAFLSIKHFQVLKTANRSIVLKNSKELNYEHFINKLEI